MTEKRRTSSTHVALFMLCLTTVLLLWRHTGCPGPPKFPPPAYLLIVPDNASSIPPPFRLEYLPPDDASQLLDIHDFYYVINNDVCNASEPLVLVIVHSDPRNVEKRTAIRETWGSEMKVIFLMGTPLNASQQMQVLDENVAHRDIVQGNFVDAYRNMTYKHVMALKWVSYHCQGARYILKTDDDVFVHPKALRHYLSTSLSLHGARRLILCNLYVSPVVQRSYRSKWRVSFSEYRAAVYPDYCPGWAVLYSPDAVFNLYVESQKADYFWIDDVFVTGLMAERANIPRATLGNLSLSTERLNAILKKRLDDDFFILGPADLSADTIHQLWGIIGRQRAIPSYVTS